jgi:hypothetical protein
MNTSVRETKNFNVTGFNELEFNPHPMGMGGIQAIVQFTNGYGASIVKTPYTYGGSEGLYELAVLGTDGSLTYDTPITDDVLGSLDENEVSEILEKIQKL